jgi:hypothetical protein
MILFIKVKFNDYIIGHLKQIDSIYGRFQSLRTFLKNNKDRSANLYLSLFIRPLFTNRMLVSKIDT